MNLQFLVSLALIVVHPVSFAATSTSATPMTSTPAAALPSILSLDVDNLENEIPSAIYLIDKAGAKTPLCSLSLSKHSDLEFCSQDIQQQVINLKMRSSSLSQKNSQMAFLQSFFTSAVGVCVISSATSLITLYIFEDGTYSYVKVERGSEEFFAAVVGLAFGLGASLLGGGPGALLGALCSIPAAYGLDWVMDRLEKLPFGRGTLTPEGERPSILFIN